MIITYNFYIDNEFATDFIIDESHTGLIEVFESSNPQFIDITNFEQVPSIGMIFNNGQFEEGINGETFIGNIKETIEKKEDEYLHLDIPRNGLPNVKLVALLDNNILKQTIFFDLSREGVERTYFALMSNPTIEKVIE